MDWVGRVPELAGQEWRAQSFATFLTASPLPEEVKEKLTRRGVMDHPSIFRRAIGLNQLFAGPPASAVDLAVEFLRNYHRYADALYECYVDLEPCRALDGAQYSFTLYASGEYSRMLESQWEEAE